jgi:hypothetical protein
LIIESVCDVEATPEAMPGQLHLFGGKRQRGIAPPAPSEFASQCCLADLIRRTINPQWRFTHVPLGEYRDPVTAGRLQRLGVVAGWPDLQFAGPDRQMVFLELKARGGRLSESQAAMKRHLEAGGFPYLCTDSVEAAIAWLKDAGILRGGISVQ